MKSNRNILIPHSRADVITNSSSELFLVCLEQPVTALLLDSWSTGFPPPCQGLEKLRAFSGFPEFLAAALHWDGAPLDEEALNTFLVALNTSPIPPANREELRAKAAWETDFNTSFDSEEQFEPGQHPREQAMSAAEELTRMYTERVLAHLLEHRAEIEQRLSNCLIIETYASGVNAHKDVLQRALGRERKFSATGAGWHGYGGVTVVQE